MLIRQMRLINRGSRRILLPAHLSLAAAFAAVFLATMMASDIGAHVRRHLIGDLPENEVRVGVKKLDTGFFRFVEAGAEAAVTNLDALAKIPGVTAAYPLRYGEQPAELSVNILGRGMRTDVALQGFPPEWIADEVPPETLAWEPGEIIPCVINPRLLTIFNNAYAKSQGMPELTADAVRAPVFQLKYGPRGGELRLKTRIVGFSNRVGMAVCMPDHVLLQLHQQLGLEAPGVTDVRLMLTHEADPTGIAQAVARLGYHLDPPDPLAENLSRLMRFGRGAGLVLTLMTAAFCLVFLNQTIRMLFLLKSRDYQVCHAMGMSLARLRLLLSLELLLTLTLDLAAAFLIAQAAMNLLRAQVLTPFVQNITGHPLSATPIASTLAVIAAIVIAAGGLIQLPHLVRFSAQRY